MLASRKVLLDVISLLFIRCRIDHWDLEKEKVVLLTANSLIIVAYDFIKREVRDFQRIMLTLIKSIEVGDLVYPPASFMG
jgi:Inositol phosphatase